MSPETRDWWQRAKQAVDAAELLLDRDPNGATSRAYFAAFAALSALFSVERRSFRKHADLRAAVHRDLIKTGKWPASLGKDFSGLFDRRHTADYGGAVHVTSAQAREAVEAAKRILAAVEPMLPK